MNPKFSTPSNCNNPTTLQMALKASSLLAFVLMLTFSSTTEAQVTGPEILDNGDLSISYSGTPDQEYTVERTTDLLSPTEWTPLQTTTSDAEGQVTFKDVHVSSPLFYRIRTGTFELPFVYEVENTGAEYQKPVMHDIDDLPIIEPLTDPLAWSDGSGQINNYLDWSRRRAEIKAEIEYYEIGTKPDRPDDITASYSDNTLTVNITVNGETLTLTSNVVLPSGDGPFPMVIGLGGGSTGSIPADIFNSRGVAQISFNFGQVMENAQTRGAPQPINKLYPDLIEMGSYSAWSWGVSRLIDGLELVQDDLPIDLSHLAVTGCSFAGKMALFAGAFDERIALTIAQEPGGGGAAAWRVSETLGTVEKLGATNYSWFMESLRDYSGNNVSKLPIDHHELMAMVAPRALLIIGNTSIPWLAGESGYVSSRAAHRVWQSLGVPERFGFSFIGGGTHCALPFSQRPEVEAFVDKFLFDDTEANTDVTIHNFDEVDYSRWTAWWGTNDPVFPPPPEPFTLTYEAECATVGSNWNTVSDPEASNGSYATVKAGTESTTEAPTGSLNHITIPFTLTDEGRIYIHWRLNCPSVLDDSFWIKMDDGEFEKRTALFTSGWKWKVLKNYTLTAGDHTLTIGYSEDGALLDKISISNFDTIPSGMGPNAENLCP